MKCDFCNNSSISNCWTSFRYKDKEVFLRVRAMPMSRESLSRA